MHPGYGFLSENQAFARACAVAGLVFIGPPPEAMAAMGEKVPARERMRASGVPVVPGSGAISDPEEARRVAAEIGYPVLIKASAGGGGIGMRVARDAAELMSGLEAARSTAERAFGNPTVFLERYVDAAPPHRDPGARRLARRVDPSRLSASARSSAATRRSSRRRPRW